MQVDSVPAHAVGGWRLEEGMDRRLLLVALAALAAVPSASTAAKPGCVVVNLRTGNSYATLQEGGDAATAGDTLTVRGTCYGDTTIDRDLSIVGRDKAKLDGLNTAGKPGSVVGVHGATVTISSLIIRGGDATEVGGGIYNKNGSVTLRRSTVIDNAAPLDGQRTGGGIEYSGGGIFSEGSLSLDHSTVADNEGGGIMTEDGAGTSTTTLTDSMVLGNVGAGIENKGGSITLRESRVSRNTVGIINTADLRYFGDSEGPASITLIDSSVTHNTLGGISNEPEPGPTVTLIDSRVAHNGGEP